MTAGGAAPAHTNDTAGARRIADAFARAAADGRAALIPYVVAGYPDADGSFAAACAAIDAGADLLEVGLPYSDPLADGATLQRASQGALANGATFDRSLALVGRIAAGAARRAGRGDGLREPADRRRRRPRPRRGPSRTRARPGSSSRTSRPTRAGRSRRSPWRPGSPSSTSWRPRPGPTAAPRSPPAAAGSCTACRSSGVTGARTALPSTVAKLVRDVKAASPVPVAVGFGVSKPAHVRAIARAGADGVIVASALVDALGG